MIEMNGGFDNNWQERFPMPESLEKPEFKTWLSSLDEVTQGIVIGQVTGDEWDRLRSKVWIHEETMAAEDFVSDALGIDLGSMRGEN